MDLTNIEKLELARRRSGCTQKDLAEMLGISLATYGRIIAKENIDNILLVHARIIEKALKVKFHVIDTAQGKGVRIEL